MPFLTVVTLLLIYQLIGELFVLGFSWPIPGPVVGMLLLLMTLLLRASFATEMRPSTDKILTHLSLLFVPAGVGLMVHLSRLEQEWLAITLALFISTVLGLLVTAWSMILFSKWFQSERSYDK
ncbi:MAG: CidA/LrgA family protein [Thiomicrorhabdus chilensis]|uniref:CidA/LrgA family protein n=1 Tax=Thiomicrorhabdus chilensis TaxID=63656 RepID=UPI00299F4A8D|nr:CidA/LrgA family protein [Thiomicrorhabdus chilensis]MDX1346885.1 CidA/LrgA family protein [Thiomicrorhabdus chilensis]